MKIWLPIVAVLILIAATGIYFLNRPGAPAYQPPAKEAPGQGVTGVASSASDPSDVSITSTDNGFAPNEVTIKKGQRVRFINNSTQNVWPASGVHPTHTLYPEKEATDCLGSSFDSCRELKPGEFFDFTFNYVGEWRYHDHVHAYNTGVVTVVQN